MPVRYPEGGGTRTRFLLCGLRGFVFKLACHQTKGIAGMIRHIVMWKFKPETTGEERLEMKRRLEALAGVVPGLLKIEVGMDVAGKEASKDMVLCSEFNTLEDLASYAVHPEHLKVVDFVKPLVCERAVVDYEA